VLDRGKVVEVGGHDELIAARGAYWRIHEAQERDDAAARAGGGDGGPGESLPGADGLRGATA
jgi:ATP-binding cassette subfamily B protein